MRNKTLKSLAWSALLASMAAAPLSANVMVYDVKVTPQSTGANIDYRLLDATGATVELEVYGPLPGTTVLGTVALPVAEGANSFYWDGTVGVTPTVSGQNYGFRINAAKTTGHAAWENVNAALVDALAANKAFHVTSPRGVASNMNMDSDLFGMVYVASTGVTATTSGRTIDTGIYGFYPDASDPIGRRDVVAAGGVTWTTSATASPYKIEFGADGKLWIPDWSDTHAGLWRAEEDLDVTTPFTQILDNTGADGTGLVAGLHGSISGVRAEMSGANTVIYWQDEDLTTSAATSDGLRNIYSLTFTPSTVFPVNAAPTLAVDENSFSAHPDYNVGASLLGIFVNDAGGGLERDNGGNFWISNFRATGDNWPCLMKIDPTGATMLWDSRTGGTPANLPENDPFAGISMGFTYDEFHEKIYMPATGGIRVLDTSVALPSSNIPAATELVAVAGAGTTGAIEHDRAGNVYFANVVLQRILIWSPPGPNSFTFDRASLILAGGVASNAGPGWENYR